MIKAKTGKVQHLRKDPVTSRTHSEAMRTNTNHSRGKGPAPRADSKGFEKGYRGTESPGQSYGREGRADLEPKLGVGGRTDSSSSHFHQEGPTKRSDGGKATKATAAKQPSGATDGLGGGTGGLAIHSSLRSSNLHTTKTMCKERY